MINFSHLPVKLSPTAALKRSIECYSGVNVDSNKLQTCKQKKIER